ncbi:MAG: S8 family serine peptidase [Thermoplasmata archaeon]|nr:MAG: S8 family serine peptidase [Thermoplasmata archaeon]
MRFLQKSWVIIGLILFAFIVSSIPVSALDISVPAIKARESEEYSPETVWDLGYTGKGINIVIMDSGVDDEHESFQDKFVAGADFTVQESALAPRDGTHNPDDTHSHGTHIAGIALGTGGTEGTYMGSAPGAGLIDLKVARPTGTDYSDVDECVNWMIENKATEWPGQDPKYHGIDILSLSKPGGNERDQNGTSYKSRWINNIIEEGILVVVGAGNDGDQGIGFGNFPAADLAIVVGSVDDQGTIDRDDDLISTFSTAGPRRDDGDLDPYDELKPDVCAPGSRIMAPEFSLVGPASDRYIEMDGTSMACPHVSGIVAQMLEANPDLTQAQVKDILQRTAEQRGNPDYPDYPYPHNKWNRSYGYGMVDAYEAVKMALEYKPSPPGNDPPVITSLTASPLIVKPNGQSTITTTATDPDGDTIYYEYTATGGTITGSGSEVTWTAPSAPGNYEITATVNDGILSSNPVTVTITVEGEPVNNAPVIDDVIITPHPVPAGEAAEIEVKAHDPEGDTLRYELAIDMGTLSSTTGSKVTWIAPLLADDYTLHIKIFDTKDAVVEMYEEIEVSYKNFAPQIKLTSVNPTSVPNDGTAEIMIVVEVSDQNGIYDIKSVTADLSTLGSSSSKDLNDRGRHGDAMADDGKYSITVAIPSDVEAGTKIIAIAVTDSLGETVTDSISVEITSSAASKEDKDSGALPGFDGIGALAVLVLMILIFSKKERNNI